MQRSCTPERILQVLTDAHVLAEWLLGYRRVVVLTGAGVSTASGIPDYRDAQGQWKRPAPILHKDFVAHDAVRRRYWARSFVGWTHFSKAAPNLTHQSLATLERQGRIWGIITQNVDGLHQRAGSCQVIDLHGRLDTVVCLSCSQKTSRAQFQMRLEAMNPEWQAHILRTAPDGDADLHEADYQSFQVPACASCAGVLKPDVIFYGGMLDPQVRAQARQAVLAGDALLVVGSSLTVASAYTLVKAAVSHDIPVSAINQGKTRADDLLQHKWSVESGLGLAGVLKCLSSVPTAKAGT